VKRWLTGGAAKEKPARRVPAGAITRLQFRHLQHWCMAVKSYLHKNMGSLIRLHGENGVAQRLALNEIVRPPNEGTLCAASI